MSPGADAAQGSAGFTLLELLVVLVLTAILLALAVPSYTAYAARAHRAEAIAALLGVAACQERVRAVSGQYDTSHCLPAADGRYRYRYENEDGGAGRSFTVKAEPLDTRGHDACGTLVLSSGGSRGAEAPGADPAACWAAR